MHIWPYLLSFQYGYSLVSIGGVQVDIEEDVGAVLYELLINSITYNKDFAA